MSRRLAREAAFKIIFQINVGNNEPQKALERAFRGSNFDSKSREFIREIVEGVQEKKEDIDQLIRKFLVDWSFERLANVDQNILRLAVFEIVYRPDIPPVTSINEAIDLTRSYQGEKSASFINGLLDRVMCEHLKE